jgi:hypothetical protein
MVTAEENHAKRHTNILLITEGFNGVEAGGAGGGVKASYEADKNREADGEENQPPGNGGNVHAGKIPPVEVKVRAEIKGATDEPAEKKAENAAEETHDASFEEEKLLDVAVRGAEGFEDADFAAAFEDGHDQGIDDAERGDEESEAAEDAKQHIEDSKKCGQALGGVQK